MIIQYHGDRYDTVGDWQRKQVVLVCMHQLKFSGVGSVSDKACDMNDSLSINVT